MESGTIMTKDAKSIIILFIAELLGAAFLTMSYVMNFGNIYSLGASFTILAIIFGKLSGGNFNLAVTFSQFIELIITGNFQAPLLLTLGILFVAQFAGGFLGAGFAYGMLGESQWKSYPYFKGKNKDVFYSEYFCSLLFILLLLILKSKKEYLTKDKFLKSFVQGAGLSIFCSLAGLVSDLGSLNPTVALAINAVKRQIVKDQIPSNENVDLDPITDSLPSFFFAPIIGGIVAVIIHRFLIEKSLDLEQKEGGLEEPLNP